MGDELGANQLTGNLCLGTGRGVGTKPADYRSAGGVGVRFVSDREPKLKGQGSFLSPLNGVISIHENSQFKSRNYGVPFEVICNKLIFMNRILSNRFFSFNVI